jgi:ferric-dicitrate binding protein FerR (iron transport regulator)
MNNTCSPEELDEILSWLQSTENQHYAKQLIAQGFSSQPGSLDTDDIRQRLDTRLQDILRRPGKRRIQTYWRWAAAAVVIAFVAKTALLRPKKVEKPAAPTVKLKYPEPPPGKNGAILTLADGRSLVLDSMADGLVASQGSTNITLNNGKVFYGVNKDDRSAISTGMNTLSTPRGRQYQLELQDGTKVWLNAASSITYPTVFNSKKRMVKVTGEAYFEVAKNNAAPFTVELADKTKIEVLGTHFNINSYDTENSFNTTLLEGSVRIRTLMGSPVLMKPGEQVQVNGKGVKLVRNIDLENVMAWKNGLFSFSDANLATVMRQLSRWYDLDVVYEGPIPDVQFNGEIDRNLTLSQVLNGLSATRIKYKIKNEKTIVILP